MPEHAEVRLTSEFINQKAKNLTFEKVGISDITQNKIDTNLPFSSFIILTISRGKELKFFLIPESCRERKSLVTGFGMTGNWLFQTEEQFKKTPHIHLYFEGRDSEGKTVYLSFQDVRRFARWHWGNWSKDRGPDPLKEANSFWSNIEKDISKKAFDGRICEVLLNQKYFNGIGNYLRAEILANADINPFISAREALVDKNGDKLKNSIFSILNEAYDLGGAQLKDWKNPFGKAREPFMDWLKVYGKAESVLDKNKRNFWYLKKWKKAP